MMNREREAMIVTARSSVKTTTGNRARRKLEFILT
jgi:hypothetical protein